jgi:hypothetical protein
MFTAETLWLTRLCVAVAIGCGVLENGDVILDTSKAEEKVYIALTIGTPLFEMETQNIV